MVGLADSRCLRKQLLRLPWYDSPTDPWNNVYRWAGWAVTSWQPNKVYFVKLGGATQKVVVE